MIIQFLADRYYFMSMHNYYLALITQFNYLYILDCISDHLDNYEQVGKVNKNMRNIDFQLIPHL